MEVRRLMAVDPSLTCSGWALFSLEDEQLLAVGKIRSRPATSPLSERLVDLQSRVGQVFESVALDENDVLVCEAATTMRDPRAAMIVEQVRGIFETLARSRGTQVPGRLNPKSVQNEVMGLRGKQLQRPIIKDLAMQIARSVYGPALGRIGFSTEPQQMRRNQDIVDALLIGSLALSRVRRAQQGNLPLAELFQGQRLKCRTIVT